MKYISHKWNNDNGSTDERLLKDHLLEVGSYSLNGGREFKGSDRDFIQTSLIIGMFHDFGKYTSYFQCYIQNGRKKKYSKHAFISALYAAYFASKLDISIDNQFYIYTAIYNHHQNLCNMDEDIGSSYMDDDDPLLVEKNGTLGIQLKDLSDHFSDVNSEISQLISHFSKTLCCSETFLDSFLKDGFKTIYDKLVDYNSNVKRGREPCPDPLKQSFLFSNLIDNDKISAAGLVKELTGKVTPPLIDKFKEDNFKSKPYVINLLREDLYQATKKNSETCNLTNHIFTITAPTGSGKTLSALESALIFKTRVESETGLKSRIVYAMPFITLLNQNYSVAKNILANIEGFSGNEQQFIISHHHLSEIEWKSNNTTYSMDEALLLVESWNSTLIVTTFVQLFETLMGNKNRALKKLHNLTNSIIIIDEIQSIKVDMWETIRRIFDIYSLKFNIYFIIMSATMPKITTSSIELSGIEEDVAKRFEKLNRTVIHVNLNAVSIDELMRDVLSRNRDKSILFMFNTIKSSIDAYNYCLANLDALGLVRPPFYISGNLIPIHREKVLQDISESLKTENSIVIGTQIFEAGVDIDFDIVVRDICPIDSVIQSSGRANRNGIKERGELILVDISKDKSKTGFYSRQVYGDIHTDVSLKILMQHNEKDIEEKDFRELVKSYYEELMERYPSGEVFISALENLRFGTKKEKKKDEIYVSDFSIIEKENQDSLFVEFDSEAEDILLKYKSIRKISNINERKNEFLKIRSTFYQYIKNMRTEKIERMKGDLIQLGSLYILPSSLLRNHYDYNTGIIIESNEGVML
jgi:CRISPR-associated endonuclease/helicase Cas3